MIDFGTGKAGGSEVPRPRIRLHFKQIGMTPGAEALMAEHGIEPATLLRRMAEGDWGELDPADWAQNNSFAEEGQGFIMGNYPVEPGSKETIWITHYPQTGDTTLLLPDEY